MLTNGKKLAKIRKIFDVCKLRKKPRQSQFAPIFTLKTSISSSAPYLSFSLYIFSPPISLYTLHQQFSPLSFFLPLHLFSSYLSLHPSSAVQPLSLYTSTSFFLPLHPPSAVQPLIFLSPSTSFLFLSLYTPFISSSASYHFIPIHHFSLH